MKKYHIVTLLLLVIAISMLLVTSREEGKSNMEETFDVYMARMQETPPSCIAEVSCSPNEHLKRALQGNYGTNSVVFGIQCPCGNRNLRLSGKELENYQGIKSPIKTECEKCQETHVIFDSARHGWDAELVGGFSYANHKDKQLQCPKCDGKSFEVAIACQYMGEEEQVIQEDKLDKIPQDLFGWLTVQVRCMSCGHEFEASSNECQ